MERAYKYRMYPNKEQQILIQKTFGCVRFVYNYYLNKRIEIYESSKEIFSYGNCCKDLTSLKKELIWLKEPDKDALQKTLKDLDIAYKKFFNEHAGYPNYKSKKNNYKSYRTSCTHNNIKYLGNKIQLPKLGLVKVRDKQVPQGRILNATISQDRCGNYYVSLCCTDVNILSLPKTYKNIGIDLGLIDYAIYSDGSKISNPKFYEQSEKKLVKLQREMTRKSRGSSNYNKARIKYAKMHKHITNQKQDFLNKLTNDIVKTYDIICIEGIMTYDLRTSTSHVHNKHLNDVFWSQFRRQLEYKCRWYGKDLRILNRYYPSSQICHVCGCNSGKKKLDVRLWICPNCKSILDRDVNAAINILNEGLKQIA